MKKFILLLGVAGALAGQTFIQMAASSSFSRAWRLAAPELTSRTCSAIRPTAPRGIVDPDAEAASLSIMPASHPVV